MNSYVISVSLYTGCYRHIQISASATLYKLHKAIISAYGFVDDHAHAFFMDNKCWSHGNAYFSMKMDGDEKLTKNARLDRFHFEKGAKFMYLFDFGDEWRFQCKFLRETEEETDLPRIIRSVGESPEQYPAEDDGDFWELAEDDDEDWDDDGDDDDWQVDELAAEALEAMYAAIPLKRKVITEIQRYFDAASRLYGLIRLDKLHEIYNSQNIPIAPEDFFLVAAVSAQEEHQYVIHLCGDLSQTDLAGNLSAMEVAAEYLFYEDNTKEYDDLRRKQKKAEYKILPKAEFLRYEDAYGHPATPQSSALLAFLKKKEAQLTVSPQEMCHAIQNYLMLDAPLTDIMLGLYDYGLRVDRKTELPEFEQIIKALDRCTPKHRYRGHTPDEMFALSDRGKQLAERNAPEGQTSLFDAPVQKPQLTLVGKPARNAPCPCGSGRKYKNCCGKNQ